MMKILQIVCDGRPGGGTNHVLQILTGLRCEYECSLLTQQDSYLADRAADADVRVETGDFFRGRLDRSAMRRIQQVVLAEQPDLIHCHGGRAAFFRSFVKSDVPTIYTVHGFHFARKRPAARAMGWMAERRSIRKCDHVVFVADFDRELAETAHLLPAGKANTVIHNGIAAPQPTAVGDRLGVGFVGRMVFQKHPELFVEMMEHLPAVDAVIVGGGELEPAVRREIESRGLSHRVKMLGEADHASALNHLSRLDVLVMTPRWEGLPLLPLEAMHMGVPVVSTAVGGVPEVVRHDETGLLADSAVELAAATRRFLEDDQLRTRITARAKEVASTEFAQQTMLDALEAIYRQTFEATLLVTLTANV